MSIAPYTNISRDDLQALATLANGKLAPTTPYFFTPFAGTDVIGLPQNITPTPTYGSGFFTAGDKVSFWLFGYQTASSVKTYNWLPLVKSFIPDVALGDYAMTWTWISVTGSKAPDGYLVVIPISNGDGSFDLAWQDIGNVSSFKEDGSFSSGWNFDDTLDVGTTPEQNLPCGHGTWLKTLNTIWNDFFTSMDLFGGSSIIFNDTYLVSGPWIVSVAPKCYLKLNGKDIYKNLAFIYSTADSPSGNELSPETDFLNFFFGPVNGVNNLTFNATGTLNGRVTIYTPPENQLASAWTVSTTPSTGIIYTFIPSTQHPTLGSFMSALQFDFTEVPVTAGTPIVLTCNPAAGHSVLNPGNPTAAGALSNLVLTQAAQTITPQTDTVVIHTAGAAAKSVVIPNTLADVTFKDPSNNTTSFETHWLTYCNGVFKANTLPTLGIFPYVDVDLPQYSPNIAAANASSRRVAIADLSLPYTASLENRGALWPVFRDTEFTPDASTGFPKNGSIAWGLLATKYLFTNQQTNSVAPYEPSETLTIPGSPAFMSAGSYDVRFWSDNPSVTLYIKGNAFPTLADHDASVVGGSWLSLLASLPGFNTTDTSWYVGIYNPTGSNVTVNTLQTVINDGTAPNGTFFPTQLDDVGTPYGNPEGFSYHLQSPNTIGTNPIPLYGYCVYSITIARQPVDNGSGILLSPSTGTSALAVSVGLMAGFGFDTAGTHQELGAFTIPAGQASVTMAVFWPVCWGAPLAYQCTEQVRIRTAVNFQPIVQCAFFPDTTIAGGNNVTVGYYDGEPFYNPNRALLFFRGGVSTDPIVLPIAAAVVNDLEAVLNLLP